MPLLTRKQLLTLILGTTLACSDGPSGVSAGNLLISISGLPVGSSADLLVTGPGAYSQSVTSTQTLAQLSAGTYTITANDVDVGAATYAGTPPSQSVSVGGSTATASIHYSAGSANLNVTITGLGTSGNAAVSVTGPNSYSRSIVASQTLSSLPAGTYTITAQDVVANGGTPHTPTPATQNVIVPPTGTVNATVTYAAPSSGALNLRIAGLYITQSAQNFDGSVPLVKDRDGYLRVFAVANRTNAAVPLVRVQVLNAVDLVVVDTSIAASRLSVPTSVDESQLTYSWNAPIPGTLIQPGFHVTAQVDPTGQVTESDETDNVLAAPPPLVQTVPTLNVTLVPIAQSNGSVGSVTAANKDQFLALTRQMHPLAAVNSLVRAPYTTTTSDTLESENGNNAWGTILAELDAKRMVEDPSRYWYGVASVSYQSGVAGVAFVSTASNGEGTALGWDNLPTGAAVAAHELGHNWSRNHAPCGGPGGVDNSYPFADGRTGTYGMDVAARSLKAADLSDIMGYCDPKWIGEYTYRAVMNYLISPPASAPLIAASGSQAVQRCMLVWGHVRNGELILEPAFSVTARPTLPRETGPYAVEAKSEDGATLFRLSFSPREIADAPSLQRSFAFLVPLPDAQASRLSSLRLSGPGREVIRNRPQQTPGAQFSKAPPQQIEVQRVAGGRLRVHWDANAYPMVMVRDPETGEILSFARGGSVNVATRKHRVELVLSNGVQSKVTLAATP
jgi:hypothetical protein